jgi:Na+/serine symporter
LATSGRQSERSSKFLKDLGIYAIGNLGSKIITFAMVPLYTFFVKDTGDFGYYDLCLTVIFLIMPFVTLQLRDVVDGAAPGALLDVFGNLLTNMVTNPMASISQANYIGILFWAILVGFALKRMASDQTINVVRDFSEVITLIH